MTHEPDRQVYLKLLRLMGIKGTHFTTDDLARELGTSKRTLYVYFASKEEMIGKTIDFVFEDMKRSDSEILANTDYSPREKIERYFRNIPDSYHIGALLRHEGDFRRHYPQLWEKTERRLDAIWDELIELVEQGIASGTLRKVDTAVLRLMLEQTLFKLLDYEYTARARVSFESGMQAMCDILLHGLLGTSAPVSSLR
ncbi:TetR family transcriptional regulator [Paenibacillus sp. 598K]|uniref:TetR/AcrR family transcriptional regulator n=1 Tax=Paenibacillus sp. 598K TaxID=1117987 RepID=UPI000FFACD56|nr:TetR/AcrR family transcriptional regulator [Paenibacillus sp. 598K]GBF76689.1 TetR family transcriptional regulator [Paenibacillus sp. 598K]